ncbi:exodeoxyribonuclease III [Candidatus Saccharibacteria bacterium]|nr:exodeoxyribonuclease III [Candidatus Saccharibacteria bacterium]
MKTTLFSWNVNGIRAVIKKGEFQKFIKTYNPDVVCLQETKAKEGQAELDILEYKQYWCSAEKPGYSGTAIFSKIEPIAVLKGLPEDIVKKYSMEDDYGHPNKEGRVLAVEYEKYFVVTVYTPNSKDDLSRIPLRQKHWDPAFLEYCKELEKKKPVLFCGDLNVAHTEEDLARPKPNVGKKGFTNEEREGFDNFVAAGFVDSLRIFVKGNGYYTWWTHWANARANNVGWRIDYWLVSKNFTSHIKKAEIHPEQMGSDHCPVSITLDL